MRTGEQKTKEELIESLERQSALKTSSNLRESMSKSISQSSNDVVISTNWDYPGDFELGTDSLGEKLVASGWVLGRDDLLHAWAMRLGLGCNCSRQAGMCGAVVRCGLQVCLPHHPSLCLSNKVGRGQ